MVSCSFCQRVYNQCAVFYGTEKQRISRKHCETEAVSGTIRKEKMYDTYVVGKRLLIRNLFFAPCIRKGNDQ